MLICDIFIIKPHLRDNYQILEGKNGILAIEAKVQTMGSGIAAYVKHNNRFQIIRWQRNTFCRPIFINLKNLRYSHQRRRKYNTGPNYFRKKQLHIHPTIKAKYRAKLLQTCGGQCAKGIVASESCQSYPCSVQ